MADREKKKGEDAYTKDWNLKNEKSFLDKTKNVIHSFWKAIIWWEIKSW